MTGSPRTFGRTVLRAAGVALWCSFLFLPFRGIRDAAVLFVAVLVTIPGITVAGQAAKKWGPNLAAARDRLLGMLPRDSRYLYLLILPALAIPFFAQNYVLDVAVLAGIYIILALGLNVVVGYTGLLNLGFVAYYAIGAYSFALLQTKLGLGFWSAMPLAVSVTTLAGFLFAVPALRLKGDYLALVTLGFGEIVRITLNNWDSFTNGPNGIGGISAPEVFSLSLDTLPAYYCLVLFWVVAAVIVMARVQQSRIGRAWIAIREDEIAASAMGIPGTLYKLYAVSFGAFWAGIAGCLFAAKMRFISPESFTFMESVLILCMVILGGLGSIGGVIAGAVILVVLPEMLREVQMYRMLALGAGIVLLMIFRPQGLFGGSVASSRR